MGFSAVSVIRGPGEITAMVVQVTKRIFTRPFQTRELVKYIDRSTAIGAELVTWVENDRPLSGRPPLPSCTSLVKIVTREFAGTL